MRSDLRFADCPKQKTNATASKDHYRLVSLQLGLSYHLNGNSKRLDTSCLDPRDLRGESCQLSFRYNFIRRQSTVLTTGAGSPIIAHSGTDIGFSRRAPIATNINELSVTNHITLQKLTYVRQGNPGLIATRSPVTHAWTSGATWTISPAASWPTMKGSFTRSGPTRPSFQK
jgi:hypothetical protein